jgi:hypothetical protein
MALYADFTFPSALDSVPSGNMTITSATIGITAASILAANPNRKGFSIRNTSNRVLTLGIGSTLTTTQNFFVTIPANGYFEWSFASIYTGAVFAIANLAGGTAQVAELIP